MSREQAGGSLHGVLLGGAPEERRVQLLLQAAGLGHQEAAVGR